MAEHSGTDLAAYWAVHLVVQKVDSTAAKKDGRTADSMESHLAAYWAEH